MCQQLQVPSPFDLVGRGRKGPTGPSRYIDVDLWQLELSLAQPGEGRAGYQVGHGRQGALSRDGSTCARKAMSQDRSRNQIPYEGRLTVGGACSALPAEDASQMPRLPD
jgi:hypothetical protein